MPILTACFDDRTVAAHACEALIAQLPGIRIAVHLAAAHEESASIDHLRSLLVEIVGIGHDPSRSPEQDCPVKLVISAGTGHEAEAAKVLLLRHHGALRSEAA